ncbi:alpha/beta hydrolase [Streptomyces sp. NBC_01795]|uniref:alpha/beta hydrolase n=1 Tax=Streptomyces sp. NBC_01795 TaxID=2975943 RepID=UPI002DD90F46|nr:alpha/beta hydrolase [Streptomyces sp. NBC_01795]WSA91229.1 alpha/beta hydrolase [Streptomyces sp. NBC_01795]
MRRATLYRTATAGALAVAALLAAPPLTAQGGVADTTRPASATKSADPGGSAKTAEETAALGRFVHQRPHYEKCGVKELDAAGALCARIRVPLDYRKPEGRTLTIGFSRIKAKDTEHRIGLMMHNSGGPGGITLDMPLMDEPAMGKKLAARYDLIGMDPRGVGRSSALHCGTKGHWLRSAGYDEKGFRAQTAYEADLVNSCQRVYGKDMAYLRHFTTRNTARDMDLLRAVLGERKTSYFGISYGTYLGAAYAKMFPGSVDRLLLDSALDPARWHVEAFRDATRANEEFLDTWSAWAARRNGTYGLGDTPREVRATVDGIARQAAREPLKVGKYTADGQQVPQALAMMMADDREFERAGKNIKVLHEASLGRPVEPTEDLVEALGKPSAEADNQNSLQLALLCADREAPHDLSWYRRNVERSRARSPLYGPVFNGVSPCALWPNKPLEKPVTSGNDLPGLIVQATGDPRTSYGNGQGLHRKMPHSRLITLKAQVHGVYGMYPNRCVYRQVNDYLRTGTLPAKDTTCEKDPASGGKGSGGGGKDTGGGGK